MMMTTELKITFQPSHVIMPTLAELVPDLVNCSRREFWHTRIFLILIAILPALLPAIVLTWIVDFKFHVTVFNKHAELPWGVHVANITLDMRRNSDSPLLCKGLTHTFPII